MVKSVKERPFSIAQKIFEEDAIVWLKESNRYIILDSTILELIKKKIRFIFKRLHNPYNGIFTNC